MAYQFEDQFTNIVYKELPPSAKVEIFLVALFKALIGVIYGLGYALVIALVVPFLMPYLYAKKCFKTLEWPWKVDV